MGNRIKIHKKNNQGFSLITVIIAMSFIGILGMLMLYIAVANFQMKVTDLKGKDSFYTAEQALEEIRTGLQEDVGDAMSTAYIKVLETYSKSEGAQEVSLDEIRQNEFKQLFIKELVKTLQAGESNTYDIEKLNDEYVVLRDNAELFDKEKETLIVTNPAGSDPVLKKDVEDGVVLKNIKVIYVDAKGYASIIQTDIRLGIPKVQFPTPSTLPDLMNMIVVADGGIICETTDSGAETSIKGSVYAGKIRNSEEVKGNTNVSIWIEPKGALSVSSGERVVCQGEINLRDGAKFSSAGEVNLWAQGITLASAEVNLLGKTYMADDLTVEAGTGSSVKIQGDYYGYGYPESAMASRNKKYFENQAMSNADLNSAIVINGKNTTLDLSGVQKLMLSGKNYISSTTVPTAARPDFDTQNKDNDIMMGESLTVKGTQLAYLAPAEILYDREVHNPMSFDEYSTVMNQEIVPEAKREVPIEIFGGKTLKDIGVDTETPVQKVFYNNSKSAGGGYVYFYLNFTDDSRAASFMQQQYKNIKTNMDEYLSFYFGSDDSGIRVNDAKTYLRYITNGNVLSYDSGKAEGDLKEATDSVVTDQLRQEQTNYQNMWYALNRKMISSYDLLKTVVKDSDGLIHNETELSQSVYDNLVNEKNMVQFIKEHHNDGEFQYKFTAEDDENKSFDAIMVHNGESSTFKVVNKEISTEDNLVTEEVTEKGSDTEFLIDEDLAESLRLLVCTGDVRIKSNVNFYGIIMAKGKITLESGAQLISSPLEAAKVFQYQIASGDYSPKDFFWEGDKYVLGNSITTGDTTETGYTTSTYDLADCITYENWKKK